MGLKVLGIGLLVAIVSGVIQASVTPKGDKEKEKGEKNLLQGPGGLLLALSFWLGPMIWSWVQFELFWNPIKLHIFASVFGACSVAFWLATHIPYSPQYRGAILTLSISMVGLPLGIVSVQGLSNHFFHHLSDVKWVGVSTQYDSSSASEYATLKATFPKSQYRKNQLIKKRLN